MKKIGVILALLAMVTFLVAGTVKAASIAPPLGGTITGAVKGEADFDYYNPPAGDAFVDWIVFAPGLYTGGVYDALFAGAGLTTDLAEYLYVYQVESVNVNGIDLFTVYVDKNLVTDYGSMVSSIDLDTFHTISGEASEGSGTPQTPINGGNLKATNISWTWDTIATSFDSGEESSVLWMTSADIPNYGYYDTIADGANLSGNVPCPYPVPEPGSMILFGLGLACLGLISKKRWI